ncbi:extradiol ring-cleavage dioxygenase [Phenylobacterium hankyongense]|uniref:Extradiol ring-cleavage dioxygenase n=1 Tax=Phenylobacterium hankyongense TaxID=1813876 RepID=A0A328AWC2_9CAUL|nr:extradiol ring-cleavage dioxygenase [Phenylobacterium hankyongense]RAK58545.1 extradiol ring-cleavage dioxygenase [Phenylobacterium hankyongense]
MGEIVGAALVSHHPGLMQDDDFRVHMGAGADSDLIAGYARLRAKIDALKPDVLVIFDTHWFTTGYHLVDGGAHYEGSYISDEMPWYLHGQRYAYDGAPDLAQLCQVVADERGALVKTIDEPTLPRHYATINVVNRLKATERIMTVGNCQTAKTRHFLEMGEVVGEAIRRSGRRAVLLASGALSHKFNDLDWEQSNPRIYHPDNVSDPANVRSDREAIALFEQGRHDLILDRFPEYRAIPWEGLGGHYLQMVGALGGPACKARGEQLSDYENARGTGNVHMWFEVQR